LEEVDVLANACVEDNVKPAMPILYYCNNRQF
jgi:hypothetical protein